MICYCRLKIIDDQIDNYNISKEIQLDIEAADDEEAPQIVAVIDERPPSLRVDEKTNNLLWKPIGEDNDVKSEIPLKIGSFKLKVPKVESKGNILNTKSFKANLKIKHEKHRSLSPNSSNQYNHRGDISPPRKSNMRLNNSESSPTRRLCESSSPKKLSRHSPQSGRNDRDSDYSPPRVSSGRHTDVSTTRRTNINNERKSDRDLSPSRTIKKEPMDSDGDMSPPRSHHRTSPKRFTSSRLDDTSSRRIKTDQSDNDNSPIRENHKSSPRISKDISPPRRKHEKLSSKDGKDLSAFRERYDSDGDISPPRKHNSTKKRRDMDITPQRSHKDLSPTRKRSRIDEDISPPRIKSENSSSPKQRKSGRPTHSRWGDWSPDRDEESSSRKPEKTMSGKRAGLQSAKELSTEIATLKAKEDGAFKNMPEEISGKNAATVVRRKQRQNQEEDAQKLQKEKEIKEKYDRWGKGLKQVESESQKTADQLYEMSKPLARYADDEDLEKYLKDQEREGDPMLAYIRKKKKTKRVEAGIPGAEKLLFSIYSLYLSIMLQRNHCIWVSSCQIDLV